MARVTAYIALGSNLGQKGQTLRSALDQLRLAEGIVMKRASTLVESPAEGGPPDQPDYLNGVVEIETTLEPQALMDALHEIEARLGRDREHEVRWGPRTCDLDLLLYDEMIIETDTLTVPHPRLHERWFVLRPLAQIAPEAYHPLLERTAGELLADLEGPA